jgi:hypothetical protein
MAAFDHPVSVVRVIEKRIQMSEDGISLIDQEVFTFRVAGDDKVVSKTASEILNAWLKANSGKAARYVYSRYIPRDDW